MTRTDRRPSVEFKIPSGKEGVQAKSVRLAAQGRVGVRSLHNGRLFALVRGDTAVRSVVWTKGEWHCDCEAHGRCSHVAACQLVVDLSGEGAR